VLTKLRIEGFKAVKQGELLLHPLTLLIGRNGSGKSSAVEALQWLQDAALDGLEAATVERFESFGLLVNRRTDRIGLNLEWDAPGPRKSHVRYSLWVKQRTGKQSLPPPIVEDEECVVGRTRSSQWIIRSRKGGTGPAVRSIHQGHPLRDGDVLALSRLDARQQPHAVNAFYQFIRTAVFLRLSPQSIAEYSTKSQRARGPKLDETGRRLVALISSMTQPQRERLTSRVQEVLETVTDVKVKERGDQGQLILRERMRSQGGRRQFDIPAPLLSEGARRLTAIFALLESRPRPSLIVIEEIENGLDPWTLRVVFDALRDATAEGTQIVLTTHSPFLLDHVAPEQVIHVTREHGDTSYHPMEDYEETLKYRGVVAPGALYVSKYLSRAGRRSSS
jgi:predicted ATPase